MRKILDVPISEFIEAYRLTGLGVRAGGMNIIDNKTCALGALYYRDKLSNPNLAFMGYVSETFGDINSDLPSFTRGFDSSRFNYLDDGTPEYAYGVAVYKAVKRAEECK